jgi:hypothetical protein
MMSRGILAAAVLAFAEAALAADQRCVKCHPKEVAGYEQSAMAHSLSKPTPPPDGSFEHPYSKTKFSIRSGSFGVIQRFERGREAGEQKVAYVIGSGAHAYGYLVQARDHLFQSPLSYYSTRRQWDVAPGYEESRKPDFSRPVTLECLLCHAGQPRLVPNTLNSYRNPAFAEESISCDRCHGGGEAHEKNPVPGSIVNPAKLRGAARDSICEQCHLAGEIRIPNPGKSMADYQPGERLEDAYTIYVAAPTSGGTLKVISHAEQLALSACARKSGGKLWCGTCHDPHSPVQSAAYFRARCLGCHGALEKTHVAAGRDCVACHMPRLAARDGGHTVFTDHRITRNQPQEITRKPQPRGNTTEGANLAAWREPDAKLRDRNLAMALVAVGFENASSAEVVRGYRMLNQVAKEYPNDPAALTSLGSVLLRAKQPVEALRVFEKVLLLKPGYAPYEVNAAMALIAAGREAEALPHLERAERLDPLLKQAVELLIEVYKNEGEASKAAELMERYERDMGIGPVR